MTEETVKADPDRNVGLDAGVHLREKWANKTEFMLSLTGMIFSVGNMVKFPFVSYMNGGGSFLYAYCVCLFFIGMPMLFLETALGQYTSEGAVTAWRKICPMFQGVGIASQVIVAYGNIYFIVILSWTIFYLLNSFKSPLPWSTCENAWNTELCHSHVSVFANPHLFRPGANWSFLNNFTLYEDFAFTDYMNETDTQMTTTPEQEFWVSRVLRVSDDMSLDTVHWDLALCLLLAWVICYLCTWKGIRVTGKVVYVTATLPYVILIILFFRGVTLPGAATALKYYFMPDYHYLTTIQLWINALYEVLYTHAASLGVLTTLGSYNKYSNDCYRDCWALSCLAAVTNIFVSLVVLSVIGFLAHELNVDISDLTSSGLLFVSFPSALSMLPASSFWAFLFFSMVFLLALDNQCLCMESLATAITDLFPRYLRRPLGREILVLVIAVVSFLLGLPFITNGGIQLFTLIDDSNNSHFSLLIIVGLEAVIISWVYGADRFYDNIEDMIGYRPFPVLKYCWMFVIPLVCWLSLMFEVDHVGNIPGFTGISDYIPSIWNRALCGVILTSVLICIPVFIINALSRDVKNITRSSKDLRQAQPYRPQLSLCKWVISMGQQRLTRSVEEGNEKMMMEENNQV